MDDGSFKPGLGKFCTESYLSKRPLACRTRRVFVSDVKVKVALALFREAKTLAELCQQDEFLAR